MHTFFKSLIEWFAFAGTMFFAAGAVADAAGGGGADGAGSVPGYDGGGDDATGAGDDTTASVADTGDDAAPGEHEAAAEKPGAQTTQEEPEVAEFKGIVSSRIRALSKQAPELAAALAKYPKIQDQIEAVFRREHALREVFPTVAEARQMREKFPNGLQDVAELERDRAEYSQLDDEFYVAGAEGNYPGHAKMIQRFWEQDPKATLAMFKQIPRLWHQLDARSYNDVATGIVASTILAPFRGWEGGMPQYLDAVINAASRLEGSEEVVNALKGMLGWTKSFTAEKAKPTQQEQEFERRQADWDKQRNADRQKTQQTFHRSFITEARKLQGEIIAKHPSIEKFSKSASPQKLAEVVEKVRVKMEQLLAKSPSFMADRKSVV